MVGRGRRGERWAGQRRRRSLRRLHLDAIEASDVGGGDIDLLLAPEGEGEQRYEGARKAERSHPPDVPDQGKADDDGKEGVDEADRAVFGHLDWLVSTRGHCHFRRGLHGLLDTPPSVYFADLRQNGEIPRRRRPGPRPFAPPTVPWP